MGDEIEDLLGTVEGETGNNDPKTRRRVASASNPLLMRLRLAALLIIGHEKYPDSLSVLTNLQVSVFALFDAIRAKTDAWFKLERPTHPSGSRYYATRARYFNADGSLRDVNPTLNYYGLKVFGVRYKAMTQSIMGEARKEYLSGIEEKSVQLRTATRDDLDIPKPSLAETITGRDPRDRKRPP